MKIIELLEAISLSYAKDASKNWDRNMSSWLYKGMFGTAMRVYIPLAHSHNIYDEVNDYLHQLGYEIADYRNNIASKAGRPRKIGALLQSTPTLYQKYQNDPARHGSAEDVDDKDLLVVISRHPVDIAGMSTGRSWESCMSLPDEYVNLKQISSMAKYIRHDIKSHSLIAYLIKSTDKNITDPIARILIRPYIPSDLDEDDDDTIGFALSICHSNVYGKTAHEEDFIYTVNEWIDKFHIQKGITSGEFELDPRLYPDTEEDTTVHISTSEERKIVNVIKEVEKIYRANRNNMTAEIAKQMISIIPPEIMDKHINRISEQIPYFNKWLALATEG